MESNTKAPLALAIFVKTPGMTPAKTRLAAGLGTDVAEAFYKKSLSVTHQVLKLLQKQWPDLSIYYAVAEGAHSNLPPDWREFNVIGQPEGGLADRLCGVANQLFVVANRVAFMGSDSPHVHVDVLNNAVERTQALPEFLATGVSLTQKQVLFGPADDGGFWWMGFNSPIELLLWQSVAYSQSQTLREFKQKLIIKNWIIQTDLPSQFDVDTINEFQQLCALPVGKYYAGGRGLLPEQAQLIEWARQQL